MGVRKVAAIIDVPVLKLVLSVGLDVDALIVRTYPSLEISLMTME